MEPDVDRSEWEAPYAVPISEMESRADQADIWLLNALAPVS